MRHSRRSRCDADGDIRCPEDTMMRRPSRCGLDPEIDRIDKYLTRTLRHRADRRRSGLFVRPDGFVAVTELLEHLSRAVNGEVTMRILNTLVQKSSNSRGPRYMMFFDKEWWIKATDGITMRTVDARMAAETTARVQQQQAASGVAPPPPPSGPPPCRSDTGDFHQPTRNSGPGDCPVPFSSDPTQDMLQPSGSFAASQSHVIATSTHAEGGPRSWNSDDRSRLSQAEQQVSLETTSTPPCLFQPPSEHPPALPTPSNLSQELPRVATPARPGQEGQAQYPERYNIGTPSSMEAGFPDRSSLHTGLPEAVAIALRSANALERSRPAEVGVADPFDTPTPSFRPRPEQQEGAGFQQPATSMDLPPELPAPVQHAELCSNSTSAISDAAFVNEPLLDRHRSSDSDQTAMPRAEPAGRCYSASTGSSYSTVAPASDAEGDSGPSSAMPVVPVKAPPPPRPKHLLSPAACNPEVPYRRPPVPFPDAVSNSLTGVGQ
eukprot:TRINITY_DN4037_c0_g2_i4.p1 TRINITY_DN4037_c0_g2~~TRINITY_DN4037_c0_g2_i4.p1  ORF type:complete len:492 (-),score=54.32 TRINITY_DN4037_c0_g2_i4:333-1808(-)